MTALRRCVGALVLGLVALAVAGPASAQEEPNRTVQVSFDVGGYDEEVGDWVVDSVEVSGDLVAGAQVTVELRGPQGRVLWTGTQAVRGALTRIDVGSAVAVGDVVEAAVSHAVATEVQGAQVEVDGAAPDAVDAAPAVPAEVEAAQVVRLPRGSETWSAAGGGAGKAQLALSMVLAIIIVAVLFRSPLPAASGERWTR
jgi:hypothetical protein